MTRAAIYVRISQDTEGKKAGVRRQEKECRELADRLGYEVIAVFRDNDVKATAHKRDEFDALCAALADGKADAVIAWKDDRLLRGGRSKWANKYLTLVMERRIDHRFVQGDDWDFSTAQGRLMVEIRLAISGYEVEQAGERQKARWRQRKEDGKLATLGRRPFGLIRDGDTMVEVPDEADAIRDAARKLIAGASLYGVTRAIADAGLQSPHEKDCTRDHPHYLRAGHLKRALLSDHLVRYGVLGADEHRLVSARLQARPTRVGRPPRTYLLSGLARCGVCGSKMAASSGSYHCQDVGCSKVGIKAALVDEVVVRALTRMQPDPREIVNTVPSVADIEAPILAELADIEDRIAALADNVDLSEAVLARRTRALEKRRAELTAQLGRPKRSTREWMRDLDVEPDPAELHDEAVEAFESVTIAPAKVRGSKIFDISRVTIVRRDGLPVPDLAPYERRM